MGANLNLLLVIRKPRQLPFDYLWSKLDFVDKVFLQGFNVPDVYEETMKIVKDHPEYTHISWECDDAVPTPLTLKLLMQDSKTNLYPVISGYSNTCSGLDVCKLCLENKSHPNINIVHDFIIWSSPPKQEDLKFLPLEYKETHIIEPVYLQAGTLPMLKRELLLQIGIRPWKPMLGYLGDDVAFAEDLYFRTPNHILQYVDFRVFVKHWGIFTKKDPLSLNVFYTPNHQSIIFQRRTQNWNEVPVNIEDMVNEQKQQEEEIWSIISRMKQEKGI